MAETKVVKTNYDTELSKIRKVCADVEKATDKYKKISSIVYGLHKAKAHKAMGYANFNDFITDQTGMGKSTCISLIAIEKKIAEVQASRLLPEGSNVYGQIIELPMRALLKMTKLDATDIVTALKRCANVDALLGEINDLYDAEEIAKLSDNEAESKKAKDGTGDYEHEDSDVHKYQISNLNDLEQAYADLEDMVNSGCTGSLVFVTAK